MSAIVIGGGLWQAPLVKYLKTKGEQVAIVNPVENETTALADFHIKSDIFKIGEVFSKIKENYSPRSILTDQSDVAVLPTAILCKVFGLSGNYIYSLLPFVNKIHMADHARRLSISIPVFDKVKNKKNIINFCSAFKPPYVLKPVDANASRGFISFERPEDVDIDYVLSKSRSKIAMIQQKVSGKGIILDGICLQGHHQTLCAADKSYFRDGVISRVEYPTKIDPQILKTIIAMNDLFVERATLNFAITHAEYIIDEESGMFWLIDIAARGGGFKISSDIIPHVCGYDLYSYLYNSSCGVGGFNAKSFKFNNYNKAVIKFYEYGSGVVRDIQGVDEVKKISGVNDFKMFIEVGKTIKPAIDGATRHAVAIMFPDKNKDVEKQVDETVKVGML